MHVAIKGTVQLFCTKRESQTCSIVHLLFQTLVLFDVCFQRHLWALLQCSDNRCLPAVSVQRRIASNGISFCLLNVCCKKLLVNRIEHTIRNTCKNLAFQCKSSRGAKDVVSTALLSCCAPQTNTDICLSTTLGSGCSYLFKCSRAAPCSSQQQSACRCKLLQERDVGSGVKASRKNLAMVQVWLSCFPHCGRECLWAIFLGRKE